MNAVEYRFYQGIVDALDHNWFPEIYYTLAHGEKVPSYWVSAEMLEALEPFMGDVISEFNERRMQDVVDRVLYEHTMRREILIWTDWNCKPHVIDGAKPVKISENGYRISPMLDKTDIMRELMESLEQKESQNG